MSPEYCGHRTIYPQAERPEPLVRLMDQLLFGGDQSPALPAQPELF